MRAAHALGKREAPSASLARSDSRWAARCSDPLGPLRSALSVLAFGSRDAKRAFPCRRNYAASGRSRRARLASSEHPATCMPWQARATRSAATPRLRIGENDSPHYQHTPPQPQGSPLRERFPSMRRIGIATKAATGSAQRKCHSAFRTSPKSVIAAR